MEFISKDVFCLMGDKSLKGEFVIFAYDLEGRMMWKYRGEIMEFTLGDIKFAKGLEQFAYVDIRGDGNPFMRLCLATGDLDDRETKGRL